MVSDCALGVRLGVVGSEGKRKGGNGVVSATRGGGDIEGHRC